MSCFSLIQYSIIFKAFSNALSLVDLVDFVRVFFPTSICIFLCDFPYRKQALVHTAASEA